MVIAKKEWQNLSKDEQKSTATANTTSTTTSTAPSSTTLTNSSSTAVTEVFETSATAAVSITDNSLVSSPTHRTSVNSNNDNLYIELPPSATLHEPSSMINTDTQMMEDTFSYEKTECENNNISGDSSNSSYSDLDSNSGSNASDTSLRTVITNTNVGLKSNTTPASSNASTLISKTLANYAPLNENSLPPHSLSAALQSALSSSSSNNGNGSSSILNDIGASAQLTSTFRRSLGGLISNSLSNANQQPPTYVKPLNSAKPPAMALMVHPDDDDDDIGVLDSNNGQAKIVLHCEPNSHPFQTRVILLTPNIECKVGRLIAKSKAAESNAIFDCKVLSRNHAVIWYSNDGKFWVKDTKSSNGTFINENKLGNDAAELHFGDIVKFGVEVLENTRKEVHGCIIACIKLYLPDGREAGALQTGEGGRISYEELHRLNLHIQEASQREKVLKQKLFNIQNVLDATRKNSENTWQAMIGEDQLLVRISSLEKKLQIMDKNVPESTLRNEIMKMIEDKTSYQNSAKEALRKVYHERCEAMELLSKMEAAFNASDNECKILREQVMSMRQTLQDIHARVASQEAEYQEYRQDVEQNQKEAQQAEMQRIMVMTQKVQQSQNECEELRQRISDLLLERAQKLKDEDEELKLQAFEKLDAAIADMDLGDDEEENEVELVEEEQHVAQPKSEKAAKAAVTKAKKLNGASKKANESLKEIEAINGQTKISSTADEAEENSDGNVEETEQILDERQSKQQSTIMKWLKNSDLSNKEGSRDIFDAICNEDGSSDEEEQEEEVAQAPSNKCSSTENKAAEEYKDLCANLNSKMQIIQENLSKLEYEMAQRDDEVRLPDEAAEKNGEETSTPRNKSYYLLKDSVAMLHEAYVELNDKLTEPPAPKTESSKSATKLKKLETQMTLKSTAASVDEEEQTLMDSDEDEDEDDDDDGDDDGDWTDNTYQASVASSQPRRRRTILPAQPVDDSFYRQEFNKLKNEMQQRELEAQHTMEILHCECEDLKEKLNKLQKQLETLSEEKTALEQVINQNKSNVLKSVAPQPAEEHVPVPVISEQLLELERLEEHKETAPLTTASAISPQQREQLLFSNRHGANSSNTSSGISLMTSSAGSNSFDSQPPLETISANVEFEQQMRQELADINSSDVQQAEELIMYKEKLDAMQQSNLQLRNEITELKQQIGMPALNLGLGAGAINVLQRQTPTLLPLLIVTVALWMYYITSYN